MKIKLIKILSIIVGLLAISCSEGYVDESEVVCNDAQRIQILKDKYGLQEVSNTRSESSSKFKEVTIDELESILLLIDQSKGEH